MVRLPTIDEFSVAEKTVLVRVDFNSPINPVTKEILDESRIVLHAETVGELAGRGARVVVLSHQGRPGDPDFSPLRDHARRLARILGFPVGYVEDVAGEAAVEAIRRLKPGEVLVLENVRVLPEEMAKRSAEEHAGSGIVQTLSKLADLYVNDAFSVSHRSQASVVGFPLVMPFAIGRAMERELTVLGRFMEVKERPCIYVLGGVKVEEGLGIMEHVLSAGKADLVLTGGLVANLFLHVRGADLGEVNRKVLSGRGTLGLAPKAGGVYEKFPERIMLPEDVAVDAEGRREEVSVRDLPTEHTICDIGARTCGTYSETIWGARAIVVRGPMGVYERSAFIEGTKAVYGAVAGSGAFTLAGGGHTVTALKKLNLIQRISYVSFSGGAMLEYLMGRKLPGLEAMERALRR